MERTREGRDPFIIGLEWEMARLGLNKKQLASLAGLKYPTLAKVIRNNGRGKDSTRNSIAKGLGYESWADLYKLGEKRSAEHGQKADNKKEDGKMEIIDLYGLICKIEGRIEKQFEDLTKQLETINHKIDSHISSISAHHSPARNKKFF